MAIRLPPRIQPMRQLPVRNYQGPGVYADQYHSNPAEYAGLRNEMGPEFNREVINTRKRRGEAQAIIAGNQQRAAALSAEFNRSSPGRRGYRMGRPRNRQAEARENYSFAMGGRSAWGSAQPMMHAQVLKELGDNPNVNRLSRREMAEYVSLKAPSGLAPSSGGLTQARWDRERLGEIEAKLNPNQGLFGRRTFRRSRRGLGRRRSRI